MNKLVASAFLACSTLAGLSAQAQILTTEPVDRIVAIAEDEVILQSELDAAVAGILQQYKSNPQQLPPRAELERQVLDRLIMLRLQVQRAQGTGIRVTDNDVDQAVQRIAAQNKIDVAQLRAGIQHDGLDFDSFRKNLREQLQVERLRQRVMQSSAQATDAEVDALLASGNVKTGEIHLAHILIALPENANAKQIADAKTKADDVKKQVDGGLDFSAAAIRYSNAQDALEGGDLGWRRVDSVPEAFVELADTLQPGQISQVIRAANGFHIIKMVEKRAEGKQVVNEYHARHIEIATSELVSSDEAQRKVTDLRRRIVEGKEDFAVLAKQFSNDPPTANLGGEMGWFAIDQFGPKVAEVMAKLKDGEVSTPFQTDVGWHIVQMLGKRSTDRTEQAKREQARDMLRQRKAGDEYESFLRTVRSEAYICAVSPNYVTADLQACGASSKKPTAP
jgi:peptidyl-prolyl cis-trans isomerase SurA